MEARVSGQAAWACELAKGALTSVRLSCRRVQLTVRSANARCQWFSGPSRAAFSARAERQAFGKRAGAQLVRKCRTKRRDITGGGCRRVRAPCYPLIRPSKAIYNSQILLYAQYILDIGSATK